MIAVVTSAMLGLSEPALAGIPSRDTSTDPAGDFTFKFLSGSTSTETVFVDGKPIVKIITIVTCGPSGSDCKQDKNGNFIPKRG